MPHSTSPPQAPPTSLREPWCEEEFCSPVPTIPLQAIFNCAACIPTLAMHTQCIYRHGQTNQHTHTILARTPDVHISHTTNGKYIPILKSQHTRTRTNWAAGSSMSVELDDSINLGQGPECARTTYGFDNTSCHKIDLLGIGTMFD